MIELAKLPFKGPYDRKSLIKLSTAKLVGLATALEVADIPDDKNDMVSAVIKAFNTLKLQSPEERVIEGPLSPEDEALVTGKGTATGEGTGESVNMKGALDEEVDPKSVMAADEVATMDASLAQSAIIKGLTASLTDASGTIENLLNLAEVQGKKIAKLEQSVVVPKDPDTLHGHVDDLKHG